MFRSVPIFLGPRFLPDQCISISISTDQPCDCTATHAATPDDARAPDRQTITNTAHIASRIHSQRDAFSLLLLLLLLRHTFNIVTFNVATPMHHIVETYPRALMQRDYARAQAARATATPQVRAGSCFKSVARRRAGSPVPWSAPWRRAPCPLAGWLAGWLAD